MCRVRGSSVGPNRYSLNEADLSEVTPGSVASFALIDEVAPPASGVTPEYGGAAAVLDYRYGGTAIVNIVTKSGANECRTDSFAYVAESLSGIAKDSNGTLWGAGMAFKDLETVPVLGFFNEDGTFAPIDTPFGDVCGYFEGIHVDGIGIAYGSITPNGMPVESLLALSYDSGQTWARAPTRPWETGGIQNAEGGATFRQFAAHDFFGVENLICQMQIVSQSNTTIVGQPFAMQLGVLHPWGLPIEQGPVNWAADGGGLVGDPLNWLRATLTASEPIDVTVTCTLPDFGLETVRVVPVRYSASMASMRNVTGRRPSEQHVNAQPEGILAPMHAMATFR